MPQPGAALRSAPGYIVAGLSGRQNSDDHANDPPVPITSHCQSTGGLQAASGTRRNKTNRNLNVRFDGFCTAHPVPTGLSDRWKIGTIHGKPAFLKAAENTA